MKILVISDTHDMVTDLKELLSRYSQEVGLVIHLGDYPNDLIQFHPQYPHLNMVAVDGTGYEINFPVERILTLNNATALLSEGSVAGVPIENEVKILIVHGHRHGVKTNLQRLVYYAQEKQVTACFFGHTHVSTIFEEHGIFFMNPGSLAFPRDGRHGRYGIVEISPDGTISGEVMIL